ncbi:FG-GAP-like repeat-containing protein [Streptomyces sp. NPDC003247]|uniref:FG-GAP-like repeat-containing protein n=1 Tax=Streptomyces sp. NPDC003247 TaxID=3364677 RepID=UPI00368E9E9B
MARHGSVRLCLVAASAVLAAGLVPSLPSTAVADEAQETVVPAALRDTYTSGALYGASSYSGRDGAGAQGVFHSLEGSGLVWTRYSDGRSVKVVHPEGYSSYSVTGGDVLAYTYDDEGRVDLWNAADGTTRSVQVPDELSRLAVYSDLVVAYRTVEDESGSTWRETHLLSPADDGGTRDVTVGGVPEGVVLGAPVGGDADGLLFQAGSGAQGYRSVMVDRTTGQVTDSTPVRSEVYLKAQVTGDHVVLFDLDEATVLVFDRADLSAAPAEVTLTGGGVDPARDLAVVGDWLVHRAGSGTAVYAQPLAGGPEVTLLAASNVGSSAVSDGTAVAVGRTPAATDDWGVQRIQPGPDGSPVVTQVKALPKPPLKIQGLSLDHGLLVVADQQSSVAGGGIRTTRLRTVAPAGTPAFGPSSTFLGAGAVGNCAVDDIACAPIRGAADGQLVWLDHDAATGRDQLRNWGPGYLAKERSVPAGGRITDVSGRYVIHTTATQQSVHRLTSPVTSGPVLTRAPGPAALDGDTLWTPGTTPGSVTAYDLSAKNTTGTLTTDAGCTPTDLQALGRWLYWTCDGRAGVYDRTAKRSVEVPAGEAKLGDGYVVTHDRQAGKLTLTTVTDGTAAGRVIGDLPDTGVSQRDVRWTVDESGANAAYVDDQERVHLVPSGVPQQPLRLLEAAQSQAQVSPGGLLTSVLLSKPAAGWALEVRGGATGKRVDGTDGGAVRGALNVGWDGRDATGKLLPNGSYDWTLTVTPTDGAGAPLQVRGTVRLVGGAAVFHDYVGAGAKPDGVGDLLTMPYAGTLTYQQGTGRGTFSGQVSGGGWPSGIKAVPIGDLSGDRCNDVLVRLSSGALRLYRTGCGGAVRPTSPYTTLGTSGWNQFDVITSPGDVTKDGLPDLIARNPSTGRVYLYKGTAAGKLAAPVKLYDDWRTYKKIVGVGDLNGDGVGDLIAQDKANNLYRYIGTGKGTFGARGKLFANWGASYNAVVGAGDITGDGKADLVVRDTAGGLYRLDGTGTGTFGARTKIGAGWQNYKGLF